MNKLSNLDFETRDTFRANSRIPQREFPVFRELCEIVRMCQNYRKYSKYTSFFFVLFKERDTTSFTLLFFFTRLRITGVIVFLSAGNYGIAAVPPLQISATKLHVRFGKRQGDVQVANDTDRMIHVAPWTRFDPIRIGNTGHIHYRRKNKGIEKGQTAEETKLSENAVETFSAADAAPCSL